MTGGWEGMVMRSRTVNDAVESLFVRCIASDDPLEAFRRAARLVGRWAQSPSGGHFSHLACALNEQTLMLQMLRQNQPHRASHHRATRERELAAFLQR